MPDRWVPVRLGLRNPTDAALTGHVEIGADDQPIISGSGSAAIFQTPVRVPAHSRLAITTYAYFTEPTKTAARNVSQDNPILAKLQWRDSAGGFVSRSDFSGAGSGGLLVVVGDRIGQDNDSPYSAYALERIPESITGAKTKAAMCYVADLPAEAAGYDAALAVIFDGQDPEALSTAQRQALLDHVHRGGVLVIHAPTAQMRLQASWLADYLPVQIVGWRESGELRTSSERVHLPGLLKFSRPIESCEAVASGQGEEIVLRDESYVHAASKPVGLGRVVFTSFPLASLPTAEDTTERIWAELLGLLRPSHDWRTSGMLAAASDVAPRSKSASSSQGQQAQLKLMHSMIGWPVPSVRFALVIGAGYLLAAAAIHLLLGIDRRPLAYVVITGLAIAVWATVTVGERFGRQGLQLTGGRLVSLDLGADGAGRQQEAICYFGAQDDHFAVRAATPEVILRPTLASKSNPVRLVTQPLGAPAAGVVEQTPARMWLADGVTRAPGGLGASLRFGPEGAQFSAMNQSGQAIAAPLLVFGAESYRLADLASGASQQPLLRRNERGKFIAGDILGERAKLREAFTAAVLKRNLPAMAERNLVNELQVIGFVDQAAELLSTSPALRQPPRQEVMVRAPVHIEPSAVGTRVKVDGAFARLVYASPDATYQLLARGDEVADGTWVIGFAPPTEMGRLKTLKATLEADAQAPQHALQILGRDGRTLARWIKPVTKQTLEIVPTPADLDENGWLWLVLKVEAQGRGADGLVPKWQMRQLSVSYEGEVVGPPFAPVPPAREKPTTRPRGK